MGKSLKIFLFVVLGTLFLVLGLIGAFLPVLPTTPFLLLASFCYFRGSKRLYDWLINHKVFGAYIYCYLTYKAIPQKTKLLTLVFLWTSLVISMVLVDLWPIRVLLVLVGMGVTTHLLILKTLSPEELKMVNDLYQAREDDMACTSK